MLSLSTLLFASIPHIASHLFARLLQGVAGALVNVSAFSLVIEVSTNVPKDVGVQEVVIGAAYMLGPTVGGFLFERLGFRRMFLLLSGAPLAAAALLAAALGPTGVGAGRTRLREEGKAGGEPMGGGDAEPSFFYRWWTDETILLAALALVTDAAAVSFLDPTLATHLRLVFDIDVDEIGVVFALLPFFYSAAALLVYAVVARLGNKECMSLGLILVGLSLLVLGPVPFFPFPSPPSLAVMWSLVLVSLSVLGVGSALVVVPAVPLMLSSAAVSRRGPAPDQADGVASLYMFAWSVGDAIGPLLGGSLPPLLPLSPEAMCLGGRDGDDDGDDDRPSSSCRTHFRWAAAVVGVAAVAVGTLLWVAGTRTERGGEGGAGNDEAARGREERGAAPKEDYDDGERRPLLHYSGRAEEGLAGAGTRTLSSHKHVKTKSKEGKCHSSSSSSYPPLENCVLG